MINLVVVPNKIVVIPQKVVVNFKISVVSPQSTIVVPQKAVVSCKKAVVIPQIAVVKFINVEAIPHIAGRVCGTEGGILLASVSQISKTESNALL